MVGMGGSVAAGVSIPDRTGRAGRRGVSEGRVAMAMSASKEESGDPADDRREQAVGRRAIDDAHADGAVEPVARVVGRVDLGFVAWFDPGRAAGVEGVRDDRYGRL